MICLVLLRMTLVVMMWLVSFKPRFLPLITSSKPLTVIFLTVISSKLAAPPKVPVSPILVIRESVLISTVNIHRPRLNTKVHQMQPFFFYGKIPLTTIARSSTTLSQVKSGERHPALLASRMIILKLHPAAIHDIMTLCNLIAIGSLYDGPGRAQLVQGSRVTPISSTRVTP